MANFSPQVICVVDDDEAVRDSLGVLLMARGHSVRTFESARKFLDDGAANSCACLLLDMHMPEMTGLALLLELRETGKAVSSIMITAGSDASLGEKAEEAGALAVLRKPVPEEELFGWIERALESANELPLPP
jgi:two-component system, LuxR family, response regulator FixJ